MLSIDALRLRVVGLVLLGVLVEGAEGGGAYLDLEVWGLGGEEWCWHVGVGRWLVLVVVLLELCRSRKNWLLAVIRMLRLKRLTRLRI